MRVLIVAVSCAVLSTSTAFAQSNPATPGDESANTAPTVLDEVLVTGEQPGPGLWKISSGDHVMWVLGTYGPLPKKMTWRSQEVETAVAASQELLLPGTVDADIGFFKGLTLLPSLIGVRNSPNDQKLKDILSPELYARWSSLKEKYIGRSNGVEKWRPIFAAFELYSKALDKAGLESSNDVRKVVEKVAKKNKVKIVTPTVELDIEKPRAAIKEFKKSSLDDVKCFAKTIERLETDLDLMRARANAWSVGNVAALRQMTHVDQATACIEAVMNTQIVQERGWQDVPVRVAEVWLTAAEDALAKNTSTFAVLSIDEILRSDGYVAKLRAHGYAVEEP